MWVVKRIDWVSEPTGVVHIMQSSVFTWMDFDEHCGALPKFTLVESDTGQAVSQICHTPEGVMAFMSKYKPYGFIQSGTESTWVWSNFVIVIDDQSWQLLSYVDKVSYIEVESRLSSIYSRYIVDGIEFIGLDRNITLFTGYAGSKEFYCTLFQAIEYFKLGHFGNDYVLCGGRRYDENAASDIGTDVVYHVKVSDYENFNRLLTKARTVYKNPILQQLERW